VQLKAKKAMCSTEKEARKFKGRGEDRKKDRPQGKKKKPRARKRKRRGPCGMGEIVTLLPSRGGEELRTKGHRAIEGKERFREEKILEKK